jgi:hypothetical protein
MKLVRNLFLLAFAIGATGANAQATAPASDIPKTTCVKPDHYPGRLASDTVKRNWTKDVNAWGECMKKYVADLQAQITVQQAQTDGWIKTANAAIVEYNNVVKEYQAESDKANDK